MAHIRILPAVVAVLSILATAPSAAAQDIPSPYRFIERGQEAGPVVGYMDTGLGRFGFGPRSAVFYGGAYSVAVGGLVSLGGTLTFMPTDRDVVNPRRVQGDRALPDPAEVALVNVTARLRFNLTGRRTWNSIQPYAVLGGGVMFDAEGVQAEDQRVDEDERFDYGTSFTGALGGGARLLLSDRIALRGEVGLLLHQLDTPEGWLDTNLELEVENVPESEWVNARTFTLGVTYLF